MPLEKHIPVIDDRRYDDIVAEMRTRIARYTPEWQPVWSDVNDSDPGITLVQLFAWLSEMLLYRMGKVPELNYLKFLQLLGIELNPAQPAQAEISFPVVTTHPQQSVTIPSGTQVAADSGGTPVMFETERPLIALNAELDAVQSFDGYAYRDLSAENAGAMEGFAPFGPLATAGSALLLGFDAAADLPETNLDLTLWVADEGSETATYTCSEAEGTDTLSARMIWEYWAGSEWRSLNLLADATRAFTRSGLIQLKTPAEGSLASASIGAFADSRYWIRARLERAAYERPPSLLALRINTVEALQAETISDEVLGGSNGRPNQQFHLSAAPVLADSLSLEVDEGDGYVTWIEVDDFYASSASDTHYRLNRTTGEVWFGDGRNGAIPVANPANPAANVIARRYRIGGGKQGNVTAGKISALLTHINGLDANGIGNLRAAHSGRDEETLEEAKLRAPQALKNKDRAVTAEDFESLAKQVGTVRRAKALPLRHPDFPGVEVPGVVTVIVVPDSDRPDPMPSEGTLRSVCACLNERRLLTTELYVIRPSYTEISVRSEVIALPSADVAQVKEAIQNALSDYFHPLKGGEDGQGWPFGGDVYFSLVYRRVLEIDGVQRIQQLSMTLDGEEVPECSDITLDEDVLLFSTQHDIQVT
ncbi:MAG: putative baseplate assembly protein [Candidatus Thiodiazotropha sp.]